MFKWNRLKLKNIYILLYSVIEDFNLNSNKIYGLTIRYLASHNRVSDVEKLIECIRCNDGFEASNFDELITLAVQTAVDTYGVQIKASVENLFGIITDIAVKINCYIICGQLKSAYLLAVNSNRLKDIRKIKRQAELTNHGYIVKLCERKLNSSNLWFMYFYNQIKKKYYNTK